MTQNQTHKHIDKFKEAARELETDDDEERFNATLGKLAKSSQQLKDGKPTKDKKPAK